MGHNTAASLSGRGLTPAIPERTTYVSLGAVTVGIEPIVMTDASVSAFRETRGIDLPTARKLMDDYDVNGGTVRESGVSIHVYGDEDGEPAEYLRFDCFAQVPHYHYVYAAPEKRPVRVHLDTTANGEPVPWALERLRTRLAQMLENAGASHLAGQVGQTEIEAAMPSITAAAQDVLAGVPAPNGEWVSEPG